MKRKIVKFGYIIISLTLCFWSSYGYAYSTCKTSGGTDIRWSSPSATYYINTSGGPSGSLTAIWNGMQAWTNVSSSEFSFIYGGTTSSTAHGSNDGTNIVTFGALSSSSSLAVNSYWYNTSSGNMLDSDIRFNTTHSWGTSGSAGSYDVQNIGTHEHGHSLCLADLYSSSDSDKTMYGYGLTGDTKKRTLDNDDINGITYLYPKASCPSLYYWNGSKFAYVGPIFDGANNAKKERVDYIIFPADNTKDLEPYDGLYYFQIKEHDPEDSYLDAAMLAVTDQELDEVLLKRKADNPHTYSYENQYNNAVIEASLKRKSYTDLLIPVLAEHSSAGDVREHLKNSDDYYAEMSKGDTITIGFPFDPSFQSKKMILMVEGFYVPWVLE